MKQPEGLRINKAIAQSGFCSRRHADEAVRKGIVTINGRVAGMGDKVFPGDDVRVEGRPLEGAGPDVYIAFHKPRGVVTTADKKEPRNIVDYIGFHTRIFPVGRLDKDSEGLILLTNDGAAANRIMHARGMHEKEYVVTVDRPLTTAFLTGMARGVDIGETVTLPCRIEKLDAVTFRVVITQGLNRQIRRMCEALGYRVRALVRVRVMNIQLGQLPPGHWRYLNGKELKALLRELKEE